MELRWQRTCITCTKALGLIPVLQKQDVVSHTCDPSTQEMKAGGSGGVRQACDGLE